MRRARAGRPETVNDFYLLTLRDNRCVQKIERIARGDMVRLAGIGTIMLVRTISGDSAYCEWYSGESLRTGTFLVSKLENVNERSRSEGAGTCINPD